MIDAKNPGEGGFSLVELVIATAIIGLIVSFLGTGIYQMLDVASYGNGRLTAMHELQNAAYWFNIDGQESSSATGGSGLTLTLVDNSTITYYLAGTELRRTAGGAPVILARHIASANFSVANRVLTMSLASSPPGRYGVMESGTYKVYFRPTGGG